MTIQASTAGNAPAANDRESLRARRVELLLQQVGSLPTLRAVAMQVLQAASDDRSSATHVVKLISNDPALSARVISLCRCSERGRGLDVRTLDRAVVLLGFEAVRSAVLALEVFELLDSRPSAGDEIRAAGGARPAFDRVAFWRHSLGVACLAERLAPRSPAFRGISPGEAFLAGLLHDLGALTLHRLLPLSFDRACESADSRATSLDRACEAVIGMDSRTAGRRLAEHWQLPHALGDVMWLCGRPTKSLPDIPHRNLVSLITLADALARAASHGFVGHGSRVNDLSSLAASSTLGPAELESASASLAELVNQRAAILGLELPTTDAQVLDALSRANEHLGRMNAALRHQSALADRQTTALRAITLFHESAAPGCSVATVMGKVVHSAAGVFGGGFFCMLYQPRAGEDWLVSQFAADGRILRSDIVTPPPGSTAVADLADASQLSMQAIAMLPWLSDYTAEAGDIRKVNLLPLRCGWGVNAVLIHDCAVDGREEREHLEALGRTWAAAIAAAAQHEGAKRLGEHLAASHRMLVETQQELARTAALASVGEMAAGAAHEMNNPLTVISGRSQLLASRLKDPAHKDMAAQIVEQSHRLSDMITGLRMVAQPTLPQPAAVDLPTLLNSAADHVRNLRPKSPGIKVVVDQPLASIWIDADHLRRALIELLRNAMEAQPATEVSIHAQIDPLDDRLILRVSDDGVGMSEHTLVHAFDPFFSAKPAGRQPGLGLAHARRLIEASGGSLMLERGRDRGAVATIRLAGWRIPAIPDRNAA